MNQYQLELYENLMALCAKSEAFSFKDFKLDTRTYRIFTYRLASYSDFLNPGALECRGAMFEINDFFGEIVPENLASLPPHKFFNWEEVSSDINTLAEALIKQGRLTREVYEQAKRKS